jgi:integrase
MKKHGLANVTIINRTGWLNTLVFLGADLKNPDSVETILATEEIPIPTKRNIVGTYAAFAKAFKIDWEKVKVRYDPKEAFDPLEEEIDLLIGACGKVTSAFLQTLKDTGARIGEIRQLEWTDINEKNGTIAINHPGKGSRTRTVKVSPKTIAMLKNLSKKNRDYVFSPNSISIRTAFCKVRERLAERMQNPRLLKIHFHTLRHWRASREYEKTGDIYAVKELLGHKSLLSTDRYQHGVFKSDEYISKRPKTSLEEDALISAGFEYVRFDDRANEPIYRKRK